MIIPKSPMVLIQRPDGVFDQLPAIVIKLTEHGTFILPDELKAHTGVQSIDMNTYDMVVNVRSICHRPVQFDLTCASKLVCDTMGWTETNFHGKIEKISVWVDGATDTERLSINDVEIPLPCPTSPTPDPIPEPSAT